MYEPSNIPKEVVELCNKLVKNPLKQEISNQCLEINRVLSQIEDDVALTRQMIWKYHDDVYDILGDQA